MNKPVTWTTHLPALALILVMLGVLWLGWPWPEPLADGFDAQGRPGHWKWAPELLERERRSHEMTRHVLDRLLVLEWDRVAYMG